MIKKTRISKHRKIADELRQELSTRPLPPDTPIAPTGELAAKFGVSLPTIHLAIGELVAEGLLYRVRGSGTFFKQPQAPATLRIGLADSSLTLVSEEIQQLLNLHIDYVWNYLRESGCEGRFIPYQELSSPQAMAELTGKLDGILVSYNCMDTETARILHDTGLPVVIYRHEFESDYAFSQAIYDLSTGVEEALTHLSPELEEVPVIFTERTPSSRAKMNALLRQLAKAGIERKNVEIQEIALNNQAINCYRLIRLQHESFRNRILFTTNDSLASYLMNAFYDEDMQFGQDYRLASFDNQEAYGFELQFGPSISSIDLPKRQMAKESCRLLLHLIREQTAARFTIRIPTVFIPRKSSAPNAT